MQDTDTWLVQYHQDDAMGDRDITADPIYAEDDADEVRVWTETADLIAVLVPASDALWQGKAWRLHYGGAYFNPNNFPHERWSRVDDAVEWLKEYQ